MALTSTAVGSISPAGGMPVPGVWTAAVAQAMPMRRASGPEPPACRKPESRLSPAPTVLRTATWARCRASGRRVDEHRPLGAEAADHGSGAAGAGLVASGQDLGLGGELTTEDLAELLLVGLDQVRLGGQAVGEGLAADVEGEQRPCGPGDLGNAQHDVRGLPRRAGCPPPRPSRRAVASSATAATRASSLGRGEHRAGLVELGGGAVGLDDGHVRAGAPGDRDGPVRDPGLVQGARSGRGPSARPRGARRPTRCRARSGSG